MPFDGKLVETPALRRAILIDALRNLPPDHRWDFRFVRREGCGTAGCALGLALSLWKDPFQVFIWEGSTKVSCDDVAEFFGISCDDAYDIFFSEYKYRAPSMRDVSPAMVADALEKVSVTPS